MPDPKPSTTEEAVSGPLRPVIFDHDFLPVRGHPDDDECTYRDDGTDATYCGEPEARHSSDPLLDADREAERCQCDPCTLPRANGGRCPSFDTEFDNGVRSSHCLACAHCCFDDEEDEDCGCDVPHPRWCAWNGACCDACTHDTTYEARYEGQSDG